MTFSCVMQHVDITVCEDAADATAKGYIYHDGVIPLQIKKCVVVKNGTVGGNPTVDFIMEDEEGKRYVFLITHALLQSIPGDFE